MSRRNGRTKCTAGAPAPPGVGMWWSVRQWRDALAVRSLTLRYGVAVLLGGIALIPRMAGGGGGQASSLLLLLAAVMVSARYGGFGPALLTALVGTLADLNGSHTTAGSQLLVFGIIATFISWMQRHTQSQLGSQLGLISAMTSDPDAGMLSFDARGRLTSMNDAAEGMLGWTHADLADADAIEVIRQGPTALSTSRRPDRTIATVAVEEEDEFTRKDGTRFPVTCSATPIIAGGKLRGTLVTFRDDSEHKRAENALRYSEERYRRLVDTLPNSILLTDVRGSILMANQQAAESYGFQRAEELIGLSINEFVVPDDALRAAHDRHAAHSGETVRDVEYTGRRKDGSTFPIEVTLASIRQADDTQRALIVLGRDLTEKKRAEVALQRNEARKAIQHAITTKLASSTTTADALNGVLEIMGRNDGWDVGAFWRVNSDHSTLLCRDMWHASPATAQAFEEVTYRMTLASGEDLPGRAWQRGEASWVVNVVTAGGFQRALMAAQAGLASAVCVPVKVGSEVHGVIELFSRTSRAPDVDLVEMLESVGAQVVQFLERKQAEQALAYQASHDALTDLPNRNLLQRRVQRAIQVARDEGKPLALLLLDLDRFKEVNDTLGHHSGDLLLQEVSRRLKHALRDTDTVARLGGDEFAVLLPNTDEAGARVVAGTLMKALGQPMILEGRKLDVWGSLGIALYPEHGDRADSLMQRADVAMYAAKRARGGFVVYAVEHDEHSAGRLEVIAELRQAIEDGHLILHYQPKVDFKSGEVESVEALVRWPHEHRGLVPPDEFIPLAEQTGLIAPLTRWVLRTAMRQTRAWYDQGIKLRVAVNLAAQSLHDPTLIDVVASILREEGADSSWLELELTETAIMMDSARALATLQRLYDMGIRIAIDDFGTGYSSLSYLKQLPVHELKIDRSFLMEMERNDSDAFIAQSVIDLGHNLGLEVVAEGIQSQKTWDLLSAMECDSGQGYYSSRPLPAAELTTWLDRDNAADPAQKAGA